MHPELAYALKKMRPMGAFFIGLHFNRTVIKIMLKGVKKITTVPN